MGVANALRRDLPEPPSRVAKLPVDGRGYPVPWFVAWIDGTPDFRVVGERKVVDAVMFGQCWICGEKLGRHVAYVVGPMCAVNRVSSEPPSHRDCAVYAARACPFLVRPHMRRREAGLPTEAVEPPGVMLRRNPGVALVWVTKTVRFRRGVGLFDIGEPTETLWFAEGRPATRNEVVDSIDSGMPSLLDLAKAQSPRAVTELAKMAMAAHRLVPAR